MVQKISSPSCYYIVRSLYRQEVSLGIDKGACCKISLRDLAAGSVWKYEYLLYKVLVIPNREASGTITVLQIWRVYVYN